MPKGLYFDVAKARGGIDRIRDRIRAIADRESETKTKLRYAHDLATSYIEVEGWAFAVACAILADEAGSRSPPRQGHGQDPHRD